jgi:hypothetical protein
MYRNLVLILCLVLFSAVAAMAQDKRANSAKVANAANGTNDANAADGSNGAGDSEAKTLSGMSVLGNQEAPMSLFIVPWKSSELGAGTNLHRMLDERDMPVDRDVFMRELKFYQVSVGDKTSLPVAGSQILNSR